MTDAQVITVIALAKVVFLAVCVIYFIAYWRLTR